MKTELKDLFTRLIVEHSDPWLVLKSIKAQIKSYELRKIRTMLSYETNENFTSILFPLYVFKFREESITKFITYGNRNNKGIFISIIGFEIRS